MPASRHTHRSSVVKQSSWSGIEQRADGKIGHLRAGHDQKPRRPPEPPGTVWGA